MAKATFNQDGKPVRESDVAAWAKEGSIAIGRQTRVANFTGAAGRTGRHTALTADEKATRRVRRESAQATRKEATETLAAVAAMRRARRQAEEEEERAGRRRRLVVKIEREPKVTASGGRNLYRRHERFERMVMPKSFSGGGSALGRTPASLVIRIKGRSLGGNGRSRWRQGEAARFARYLVRLPALVATPELSVVTNIVEPSIARDSDAFVCDLVAFMIAAEETERAIDPQGLVYKSIIIALPHDLGADGHLSIVQTLTNPLRARNLPFLPSIHASDPTGDQRSVHLHLMVLLREFEPVGERAWSFRRTKMRDVFSPAMLKVWRRMTVRTFNHELQRAGSVVDRPRRGEGRGGHEAGRSGRDRRRCLYPFGDVAHGIHQPVS